MIDLSDVNFIDEIGKGLLRELGDEGAEFVAKGVYTTCLLENLTSSGRAVVRTPKNKGKLVHG